MRTLSHALLAALLVGAAASTQAASPATRLTTQRTPADRQAGKRYGQEYAAQTAAQYGYGTPTYYSQIENEDNYAEEQKTDPDSPQPRDFWTGVQLGLYSN